MFHCQPQLSARRHPKPRAAGTVGKRATEKGTGGGAIPPQSPLVNPLATLIANQRELLSDLLEFRPHDRAPHWLRRALPRMPPLKEITADGRRFLGAAEGKKSGSRASWPLRRTLSFTTPSPWRRATAWWLKVLDVFMDLMAREPGAVAASRRPACKSRSWGHVRILSAIRPPWTRAGRRKRPMRQHIWKTVEDIILKKLCNVIEGGRNHRWDAYLQVEVVTTAGIFQTKNLVQAHHPGPSSWQRIKKASPASPLGAYGDSPGGATGNSREGLRHRGPPTILRSKRAWPSTNPKDSGREHLRGRQRCAKGVESWALVWVGSRSNRLTKPNGTLIVTSREEARGTRGHVPPARKTP